MREIQRFCWLSLLCIMLPSLAVGQGDAKKQKSGYVSPLDGELALSGSFGEVRARHFHSGTDYRTGGREGMSVFAVASGEVVRIVVSTKGYGLALYVLHPQKGTMSVYGHLQGFNPTLTAWVREQQYMRKSYEVDLYPARGQFPVEQRDLLGWSGNSGSSGGPHLHFELRLAGGTIPSDAYLLGIKHRDVLAPSFKQLVLYDVDTSSYEQSLKHRRLVQVQSRGHGYALLRDTLEVGLCTGLGVEARDEINSASLLCSPSSLRLFVDEQEYYQHSIDRVVFKESAYAEAYIDYALREINRKRVNLLFALPGNFHSCYRAFNKGLLRLRENEVRSVRIVATDVAGNESKLEFYVKGKRRASTVKRPEGHVRIEWNRGEDVKKEEYTLTVPAGGLFYDIDYTDHVVLGNPHLASARVTLHNIGVPLRTADFSIRGRDIPPKYAGRVYLAKWNRTRQRFEFYGKASRDGDWYYASIRHFGTYALMIDSIPPSIDGVLKRKICNQTLQGAYTIQLKVQDFETGVATIQGGIDAQWALWEWEPKIMEIAHQLDSTRTQQGKNHLLRLEIRDQVGNATKLKCPFYW